MNKQQLIDLFKANSACTYGLDRFTLSDCSHDVFAQKYPSFAIWAVRFVPDGLSSEVLNWCIKERPAAALHHIPHLLTAEMLDWCASCEPYIALKHAKNLLTPERLDWCELNTLTIG